ncbi:MAG: hypothetical protein ACK5HL_04620 [Bacilli bacterium]
MEIEDLKMEFIAAGTVLAGLTIAYLGMCTGLNHKVGKKFLD